MSVPSTRKRRAPGTSPVSNYDQQLPKSPYMTKNVTSDHMVRWKPDADGPDLVDGTGPPASHQYDYVSLPSTDTQTVPSTSNSLARRPMNHALVPAHPQVNYDPSIDAWADYGDGALVQTKPGDGMGDQTRIEVLEEMAQKAKREAQSKRKQIPPFVQKLSSFLEERKNEELIRWSENGDSFIVLDEDEFARTLIPELFKHNNYASFVRQLNMYGFHKRVGLSDNSMRASERKNKSPSEYYNPFFRRGHPELLWLISKPKGGSKAKKGSKSTEGEAESDEEPRHDDGTDQRPGAPHVPMARSSPSSEATPLPKKEMAMIREELNKVREQQKMILGAINHLQRNNDDLYNQALMFQNQHSRHQNSINAILNFLANVFRKTLEDGGNSQNVGDIISSMMANQGNQTSHSQGSVFHLGDLVQNASESTSSLSGTHKRARGLLPPIPKAATATNSKPGRPSSPAATSPYHSAVGGHNPQMGHVTELADGSETPLSLHQELRTNPQERMMKIINDHNATNPPSIDLPEAAERVANAPSPLSAEQRTRLAEVASSTTATMPGSTTAAATHVTSPVVMGGDGMTPTLSPIMRSPTMLPPSIHQISTNQIDLDQLQRLQSEQDAKIHELSEMLGPLSPSGQIPGLGEGDVPFEAPNVDLDQYFDSDAFLNDVHFGGDGNDFNFNLDPEAADKVARDAAGEESPSTASTEEISREDFGAFADNGRAGKRRRFG